MEIKGGNNIQGARDLSNQQIKQKANQGVTTPFDCWGTNQKLGNAKVKEFLEKDLSLMKIPTKDLSNLERLEQNIKKTINNPKQFEKLNNFSTLSFFKKDFIQQATEFIKKSIELTTKIDQSALKTKITDDFKKDLLEKSNSFKEMKLDPQIKKAILDLSKE